MLDLFPRAPTHAIQLPQINTIIVEDSQNIAKTPTTLTQGSLEHSLASRSEALSKSTISLQDDVNFAYDLPEGIPEKDYIDLLKRATKNVISVKDKELLDNFMISMLPSQGMRLQRAMIEQLAKKDPSKCVAVTLNKYALDFNLKGRQLKVGEEVVDILTVELKYGKQAKVTLQVPEGRVGYSLKVEPATIRIKPKEPVEFRIRLSCSKPIAINEVLQIEVESGLQSFVQIQLSSQWSNFGSSLKDAQVQWVDSSIYKGISHKIPAVLDTLFKLLIEQNGFHEDSLFRKWADDEVVARARINYDLGQRLKEMDNMTVSSLIKVWMRELPDKLLNVTPKEVQALEGSDAALTLFGRCYGDKELNIFAWIVDLMCKVVQNSDKNGMTAKKLSIVMAPNLFPSGGVVVDVSYFRKSAEVLTYLIEARLQKVSKLS